MKITFETITKVYLGRDLAGEIREVPTILLGVKGFQYFPKGSKQGGDVFPTLQACKDSL